MNMIQASQPQKQPLNQYLALSSVCMLHQETCMAAIAVTNALPSNSHFVDFLMGVYKYPGLLPYEVLYKTNDIPTFAIFLICKILDLYLRHPQLCRAPVIHHTIGNCTIVLFLEYNELI